MMLGKKKPASAPAEEPIPGVPSRQRKKPHVWAWLFLLVLSGAGFGASVWYCGGVASAIEIVTTADYRSAIASVPYVGPLVGASAQSTVSPAPKPATVPTPTVDEVFAAQMAEQNALTAMAEGRVRRIVLGSAEVSSDTATVPFSVEYTSAPFTSAGKAYFVKSGSAWRLAHPDVGGARTVASSSVPSASLVATLSQQQLLPQNQKTIAEGALGKGFTTINVIRVTRTPTGVSADLEMTGGSWVVGYGRIALTRRAVGGRTYWFFSAIEQP